jgi:hypothetical protein
MTEFLTADEARVMLEWRNRRNAEIRAKAPPGCTDLYARLFPPVSDEVFRRVMQMALLGECPDPRELPPLKIDPRSPADEHE